MVNCQYTTTIVSSENGFTIAKYKLEKPVTLPDGSEAKTITAKGYLLPTNKGLACNLEGEFVKYKRKDGSVTYTFAVTDCEEVPPSEKEGTIAYLRTLSGVGEKLAKKLYEAFGDNIYNILENDLMRLSMVKGISENKAKKISNSYGKRKFARKLFAYLFPYKIPDSKIIMLYKKLGADAVEKIKANPYCITDAGISFGTAEIIAEKEGIPPDFPPRMEAGILEVLLQGECGGNIFRASTPFPYFVYDRYLQPKIFKLLDDPALHVTGSTYLPREVCYLLLHKLLQIPITEKDFDDMLVSMHMSKKLFLSIKKEDSERKIRIYRYNTARAEYASANQLALLMNSPTLSYSKIEKRVYDAEKQFLLRLSDEQTSAVITALRSPVSIITGGPGTGKTAVQKMILEVYRGLYPEKNVLLMAPTGRAAKRMSESTGYPASTLHKALSLFSDESGNLVTREEGFTLNAGLIIVDECSMVGSLLMEKLLEKILPGTHLVFVGDTDQLPSIEVGCVLKELIASDRIPLTRLTKTYRQASGSAIAINAARIRNGVTDLTYDEDFVFIPAETSSDIAEIIADLYHDKVQEYGIDNVMCLSAFRKATKSGSNALNQVIRDKLRNDITDSLPCIERNGMKIYVGDRIMYTRNTEELSNGDLGYLRSISKNSDGLQLLCEFDGNQVLLENEDTAFIDLAFAMTIHKAQGSESKVVIMTADMAHKVMLKRALIYTGLTRARQIFYCIGQIEALFQGITVEDSQKRRSLLSELLKERLPEKKPELEQLSISAV